MNDFSIISTVALLILFITTLFSFFLLTVPTKNKIANKLLATYFIIFAIHFSAFFYTNYIELPLIIEMLRDQIIDLLSPLLFLYLIAAIYSDFKLRPVHLVHLIPFIIQIVLFIPRFYGVSETQRIVFSEHFNDHMEVRISSVFGTLVVLFYLVLMYFELRKYSTLLKENYADTTKFNYKWLYQLTVFVTFIFVFSLFKQWYKFTSSDIEVLNTIRFILTLLLLGFLSWIVLKSMYRPELFRSIDGKHQLVKTIFKKSKQISTKTDGRNSSFNSEIKQLKAFMEIQEPYLDPSLTVQKLADRAGMSSKELSLLINHHLGQHFFDFITEYRIKKAIVLLDNPDNAKLTILEILYDVGFNSKSPFNKAFKKHTGLTPTSYRLKHCKSN